MRIKLKMCCAADKIESTSTVVLEVRGAESLNRFDGILHMIMHVAM